MQPKPWYKRPVVIAGGVIAILAIAGAYGKDDDATATERPAASTATSRAVDVLDLLPRATVIEACNAYDEAVAAGVSKSDLRRIGRQSMAEGFGSDTAETLGVTAGEMADAVLDHCETR